MICSALRPIPTHRTLCTACLSLSKVLAAIFFISWDYPIDNDKYSYFAACEMNMQGYYSSK